MGELVGEILRFGLVGAANTALGLGITSALDLGLHINPQGANAVGYAAGMVLSYAMSRAFVFRRAAGAELTAPKFVAALAIAFAVNQVVLLIAGRALGPAQAMHLAAQALAMGSYTVVNFLLCRFWVFRQVQQSPA
jgi:putative flippase GtrA